MNQMKKIFIDMRRSKGFTDELEELSRNDADIDLKLLLTKVAEKKTRLKVLAYSKAEYWYAITNRRKMKRRARIKLYKPRKIYKHRRIRRGHGKPDT